MTPLIHGPGQPPAKFRVGQAVRIKHGFRGMLGEVVEDRGPIGVRGRRLYAVRLRLDPWNEHTTELPEESIEPVTSDRESPAGQNGEETN